MKKAIQNTALQLCLIKGVEGFCVTLNDYRIAGPKAWGGGVVVHEWSIPMERLMEALIQWRTPPTGGGEG